MKNICVMCAAKDLIPTLYYEAAREIGHKIGQAGYNLVFGGTYSGLMKEVTDSVHDNGGKVIAVVPEDLCSNIWDKCDKRHNTKTIEERKLTMFDMSDAFVFLPGGIGTLDEFFSLLEIKRAGHHSNKPIVLLNINNFYEGLLTQIDTITEQKFAKDADKDLFYVTQEVDEVMRYIESKLS